MSKMITCSSMAMPTDLDITIEYTTVDITMAYTMVDITMEYTMVDITMEYITVDIIMEDMVNTRTRNIDHVLMTQIKFF